MCGKMFIQTTRAQEKRVHKDWEDAMKYVDAKKDDLQQNNLFAIKLKQWYISWRWKHDL